MRRRRRVRFARFSCRSASYRSCSSVGGFGEFVHIDLFERQLNMIKSVGNAVQQQVGGRHQRLGQGKVSVTSLI